MWKKKFILFYCIHVIITTTSIEKHFVYTLCAIHKVDWYCCINGHHCPMFPPFKIAFNSWRLFISSTMATYMCDDTLVKNANVISSFKHWELLVFFIKRSRVTSFGRLHKLHTHPTSSPIELYQIPRGWRPNSNFLVLGLKHFKIFGKTICVLHQWA